MSAERFGYRLISSRPRNVGCVLERMFHQEHCGLHQAKKALLSRIGTVGSPDFESRNDIDNTELVDDKDTVATRRFDQLPRKGRREQRDSRCTRYGQNAVALGLAGRVSCSRFSLSLCPSSEKSDDGTASSAAVTSACSTTSLRGLACCVKEAVMSIENTQSKACTAFK